MPGFQAIILVCLATVPTDACNEDTAIEIRSQHVASELRCTQGWQDVIARGPESQGVGAQTYVRTICRKSDGPE